MALLSRRRLLLPAIAAALSGVVLAAAGTQKRDPVEDLFTRARAAQSSTHGLRAAFTETTVSALLREPAVATGTIEATVPLQAELRYVSPQPKTISIDATRLIITWPDARPREVRDIAEIQRRVQKYFVDSTVKELRQSFDIQLVIDADVRGVDLLTMTPTRKQIKEGFERLRIWIDHARLLMVKMQMDFPGGDRKTYEFRDVTIR